MLKGHNQILITLVFCLDLLLAVASWELAYFLRFFWINLPPATVIPPHYQYLKAEAVLVVMTGIVFGFSGVYHSHRISTGISTVFHLVKACLGLFIILLALAFFYRKFSYSRVHMVYFMVIYLTGLIASRHLVNSILNQLHKRGIHTRNVLVVGTSEMAKSFVETLLRYQNSGMVVKGVVGLIDSIQAPTQEHAWGTIPLLGSAQEIGKIVEQHDINQVFIAITAAEQPHLNALQAVLHDQLVDIKIIPDLGPFKRLHTDVERFEEFPVVTVTQSPMMGWNLVLKRGVDVVGALTALLLFSPIMLTICVLIKLTSPGPILYRQERMGLDGNTFQTLKFRSMRINAEQETGAVWAKAADDRRTAIGSFMRKTSLDELPQLFNVLLGDMSLVGPRPERPVFIQDFKQKIPNYMLRHKVKAGMTGWAQINGWRGNTSLEKRIEFDLFYVEHWSLWFDLKILFLTIFKGFIDPNAY